MIEKAIIPAGGMGTRLLPATKEQPKEMLPVFSKVDGESVVKPILQVVFEDVYNSGVREFCFITGRTKRAIEDHFTPFEGNFNNRLEYLKPFHDMLRNSRISWINQNEPKGFGHAIQLGQNFAGNDDILVHAGDTMVVSDRGHLNRLYKVHQKYNADATLLVEKVEDPRKYGVIVGDKLENGIYKVNELIEKPEVPPSNLAITGMYSFKPIIFKALQKTNPGKGGEIQLTDAIQKLVEWEMTVKAVEMEPGENRIDIGNPTSYREALDIVI